MKAVKQKLVDIESIDHEVTMLFQMIGGENGIDAKLKELETRIAKLEEGGTWRQLIRKLKGY